MLYYYPIFLPQRHFSQYSHPTYLIHIVEHPERNNHIAIPPKAWQYQKPTPYAYNQIFTHCIARSVASPYYINSAQKPITNINASKISTRQPLAKPNKSTHQLLLYSRPKSLVCMTTPKPHITCTINKLSNKRRRKQHPTVRRQDRERNEDERGE